jgi:catechol 2,3-dioxygenase
MSLPPETRMGPVHLSVSELARSLDYYENTIGLRVRGRDDGHASLGGDEELLVLVEEPGARSARGHTGLFHFALLVPERADLARWLGHAARDRVPLTGASDHVVSEALYLRDPDEHGIEIYADRPREQWEGRVAERMTTLPLGVDDLLRADDGAFEGLPAGTVMGHVHLCVRAIPESVAFYRDTLGFDLVAAIGDQAAFLSAGGYHHHIGANTWESAGAPPAPPGTARLLRTTIVVPGDGGEREVRDPSGNTLVLAHG